MAAQVPKTREPVCSTHWVTQRSPSISRRSSTSRFGSTTAAARGRDRSGRRGRRRTIVSAGRAAPARACEGGRRTDLRLEALLDDPRAAELAALLARLDSGDSARRGEVVGCLLDSTDVEALVHRSGAAGDLIDRLDVDTAADRTAAAGRLAERLERLWSEERLEQAAGLVDRLDDVLTGQRLAAVEAVVDRVNTALCDERLNRLAVLVDELTRTVTVDRLAALADQAPRLVEPLERGDLPSAPELRQVAPDLHAMLELVDELHQVLTGLPGATLARAAARSLTHRSDPRARPARSADGQPSASSRSQRASAGAAMPTHRGRRGWRAAQS